MSKTKYFGKRALIILLPMFFVILGAVIFIGTHKKSSSKEDIIETKKDVDDIVWEVREKIKDNDELKVTPIEYYSNKDIFYDIQVKNEEDSNIKYIGYIQKDDSFEDFKEENRYNYDCIIKVEDKSEDNDITSDNKLTRTDNISKDRKVYIRNSEGQLVEYKGDE